MKKCIQCDEYKPVSEFRKDISRKDGLHPYCITCLKIRHTTFNRSLRGVVNSIYQTQKASSRKRRHPPPKYTMNELYSWVIEQPSATTLYTNWVNSGYVTSLKPSVDRLNNSKGYSFDNIQLVTWRVNNENGIESTSFPVLQFNLDGGFIKKYSSINKAANDLNISAGHISRSVNDPSKKYTVWNSIWILEDYYTDDELLLRINAITDPRVVIRDNNVIYIYSSITDCRKHILKSHENLNIAKNDIRSIRTAAENPNNKNIWYYRDTKKYLAYKE